MCDLFYQIIIPDEENCQEETGTIIMFLLFLGVCLMVGCYGFFVGFGFGYNWGKKKIDSIIEKVNPDEIPNN